MECLKLPASGYEGLSGKITAGEATVMGRDARREPAGQIATNGSRRQPHVLVVEDDPAIRELFAAVLADRGYRLTLAVDGASAESALREGDVDLLVLDWELPDFDAPQLLGGIGALGPMAGATPVMVVSAWDDSDHIDTALALGVDSYLTKPFTILDLEVEADRLLRR